MRTFGTILAICVGLGITTAARAQHQSAFSSISPNDMKFTPINTKKNQIVSPAAAKPPFSLSRFVPHLPSFLTPKTKLDPQVPLTSAPNTSFQGPVQPIAPFTPR
jgi:hypothetical protein